MVRKVWDRNAGLKSLLWKVPELNLAGKKIGVELKKGIPTYTSVR